MSLVWFWLCGFQVNAFIASLMACPCKAVSLPVTGITAVVFGWLGFRAREKS
jgi:hypothetical protein